MSTAIVDSKRAAVRDRRYSAIFDTFLRRGQRSFTRRLTG